jgi:hypothetical protein
LGGKLIRSFKHRHLVRLLCLLRNHRVLSLQFLNAGLQLCHLFGPAIVRYIEILNRSLHLLVLFG